MKWSIRVKFLIVMCGLLSVCLGVYMTMAIAVFKTDKTQLVFDLNRSQVSNLISQIETQLGGVSDQLKLFSLLDSDQRNKMAEDLFSQESDIVSVSIYRASDEHRLKTYSNPQFLDTYELEASDFAEPTKENKIPFAAILREGQDVWNASGRKGPPLLGFGRLVILQDGEGQPRDEWAVVGFMKLDRFLNSMSAVELSQIYVANRRGEILIAPDAKRLLKKPTVSRDPLFQEALNSQTKISLVDRNLKSGRVLAAYAKGFKEQIFVVATASGKEVFQVVQDFTTRTFLFGLMVMTLVILAAILLSRPITENIALLVDRMNSVSEGDLTTTIELKSRDETVALARTFNKMIQDLRESRDALESMNRDLDQKVKERTAQLEEQNKKVKEVQEALIHSTRLASLGEIAGRTAHEVLNPLTIILTRLGLMQRRLIKAEAESLSLIDDIRHAWKDDLATGGFERVISNWQTQSKIHPGQNLFTEDLENIEKASEELRTETGALESDIRFVKEEGERIGKIVNSMRRLGNLKSEGKDCSLHAILDDCCQIMHDLFAQKNFLIKKEFLANRDVALVDRDEMVQAITNLMRNSLHALEESEQSPGLTCKSSPPSLTVRSSQVGKQFLIEIEDNGSGIAADHQTRLFESSFTTKTAEHGTGLGLSISRRFVRGFGGEIEFVHSQPWHSTLFRVHLPLIESAPSQGVAA